METRSHTAAAISQQHLHLKALKRPDSDWEWGTGRGGTPAFPPVPFSWTYFAQSGLHMQQLAQFQLGKTVWGEGKNPSFTHIVVLIKTSPCSASKLRCHWELDAAVLRVANQWLVISWGSWWFRNGRKRHCAGGTTSLLLNTRSDITTWVCHQGDALEFGQKLIWFDLLDF